LKLRQFPEEGRRYHREEVLLDHRLTSRSSLRNIPTVETKILGEVSGKETVVVSIVLV
jgi:hypothetical protein